ncbi:hypothetical protein PENSPDRAFT_651666 [Peniophora sp. CONT]|nr:hypothetical protein PENSPDRAFT_651666 [Peniophora sp. CONT]
MKRGTRSLLLAACVTLGAALLLWVGPWTLLHMRRDAASLAPLFNSGGTSETKDGLLAAVRSSLEKDSVLTGETPQQEIIQSLPFDPVHLPDVPPPPGPPPPPLITFIVLWSPDHRTANYLPNFFASVGANPRIEVLLIKFDKYNFGQAVCEQERAPHIKNVREVCVPLEEYYRLHADYLCQEWGCTEEQQKTVREVVKKRFEEGDRVNSSYRPFRAEVFKQYMSGDVGLWGWCDLDQMFGNLDRTFPWDLVNDYDVFIAGAPTGNPKMQLFMPGHMTVFRNSPEVAREFLKLEEVSSYDKFMTMEWIIRPASDGCEEGEYSHALLVLSTLRWLRFDAVVDSTHHISTLDGVFSIENWAWIKHSMVEGIELPAADEAFLRPEIRRQINAALRKHRKDAVREPSFSPAGQESEIAVRTDDEIIDGWFLWFPRRYAVLYMSEVGPTLDNGGRNHMRYTGRTNPAGPVTERFEPIQKDMILEPLAPIGDWHYSEHNRPWLRESLYNHFQNEKYSKWWTLPDRSLRDGEVLYIDKDTGAHIWNEHGDIMWQSSWPH